jgi:hypothetical protein
MKRWVEIEGQFLVDVDVDEFCQELLKWITEKGWLFAGVTNESDDEIPEGIDDEDIEVEQVLIKPNKKGQH